MKVCTTCHVQLPYEDFHVYNLSPDGRQHRCRECFRRLRAENPERMSAARLALKEKNRKRMLAYLRANPCVDCGETDIRLIEFDHRPAEAKKADVGRLMGGVYAWRTIAAELAKCDPLCVNCHRRRTMARADAWRQRAYLQQAASMAARFPTYLCALHHHRADH